MPDWTRGKRTRVCILLGFILCLTSSFLTFDWTQYYLDVVRISDPELAYTRIAKTLTSFLVFLLVLSIGDDGVSIADTRKLRRAFIAIFTGDLLFLLDEIHPAFDYLAVLVFMIGHVLIILRNGQGVWAYLRAKSAARHRTVDLVTALGVVFMTAILFVLTLLERLRGRPLLFILVVYAAVLDLSLWTGWASTRAGYFPRRNALLIASGALCFFVGDYLVGFNLTLEPSLARATTLFATWIFYTPAIALFALSGYRWEEQGARS